MENENVSISASKTPFEEFLLAEYSNLAQAFFSAGTSITHFFQFYLLILGIPLTALGLISKASSPSGFDFDALARSPAAGPIGWFFVAIAIVGFLMGIYIANLRLDALLYAHAVNGIRLFFYERSSLERSAWNRFRGLPVSLSIPGYFEPRFFLPVIIAFAIFNAFYLSIGLSLLRVSPCSRWWGAVIFALLHIGCYVALGAGRRHDDGLRDVELTPLALTRPQDAAPV